MRASQREPERERERDRSIVGRWCRIVTLAAGLLAVAEAQTVQQLLRSALELERTGCQVPLPHTNIHRGGGHRRRTQLGMGKLWQHSQTCDPTTLRDRAAEVDQARCAKNGGEASCKGGLPQTCDWKCAIHFVPFYADCGATLAAMGQNLASTNAMCMPSASQAVLIRQALTKTQCPNPIKSCHSSAGPVKCVDKHYGAGVGSGALADCEHWTSQGGGWVPGVHDCSFQGFQGNLIKNGNFETPSLSALPATTTSCPHVAPGKHVWPGSCPYKYVYPIKTMQGGGNIRCTSGCALAGWTAGERDTNDRRSTTGFSIRWGCDSDEQQPAMGWPSSMVGQQYLAIQGAGAYIEQTIYNLQRGQVYELRLKLANRPGYGDDERLVIKIDNHIVGESGHPSDKFSQYGIAFTARVAALSYYVLRMTRPSTMIEQYLSTM